MSQDFSGLSEQQARRAKVRAMQQDNIPQWTNAYPVTVTTQECRTGFDEENKQEYSLAGRLVAIRLHGKTAFAHLQDRTGKLQLYIRKDVVGAPIFDWFVQYVDVGDIIWVSGILFRTKMGEITLNVEKLVLLSKCLHPLPEKFHGLSDIETIYRQRYLDLITNQESRQRFVKRGEIIKAMRTFFEAHDFMEVETPMLHPIPGGAAARPFVTHHNALDSDFYLRVAPELYLKRLVVGGFERVFEINRNFRNEGISTKHNPEFTMIEWYMAHQDYEYMMGFVQELLQTIVQTVCGTLIVPYGDTTINFSVPFKKLRVRDAVLEYTDCTEADLRSDTIDATLSKYDTECQGSSLGTKIYALFEALVENKLIQPTFITHFPIEVSPLSKRDEDDQTVAARFELFVVGMELANGFNELNDPFDQDKRFKDQGKARQAGNVEAHYYDAEYITALEYGMPPTVGVGLGIDRLTMLLTNTTSIKDVILFPTLKRKVEE
jgi:lysyl-tRNA synthetase, class II